MEQNEAWEESDEIVRLEAKKPLDKVIPVRLSADHWRRLRRQAQVFGIGPSTLARMWILDRLNNDNFDSMAPAAWRVPTHLSGFTVRELSILKLMSENSPVKAIAEKLHVSEATVKRHLREMGRKLQEESVYAAKL